MLTQAYIIFNISYLLQQQIEKLIIYCLCLYSSLMNRFTFVMHTFLNNTEVVASLGVLEEYEEIHVGPKEPLYEFEVYGNVH